MPDTADAEALVSANIEVALVKGPPMPLTYVAVGELPPLGSRVHVPLGSRQAVGFVVAHGGSVLDPSRLKTASEPLDPEPPVSAHMLALSKRVAEYYMVPWGQVLAAAAPPMDARGPKPAKTVRVVRLAVPVAEAEALALSIEGRAPRQAEALRLVINAGEVPTAQLPAGTVPKLVERGALCIERQALLRTPLAQVAVPQQAPVEQLTDPQTAALDTIIDGFGSYAPFLLHGVTGSGKTEVYLRLAEKAAAEGGQVLLLTPEIALASQLTLGARTRFGDRVVVLHSGLSDGERRDEWQRASADPTVALVIGTRSAVFAPLPKLSLLVVDEEHDGAYKQEESPRYHARDVSLMRGRALGVPVVLGSATPSLESYFRAKGGHYGYLSLPNRVRNLALPPVEVIDLREAKPAARGGVLTRPLVDALAATVAKGEQALLFLNRRGFAPTVLCRVCGHSYQCAHCQVSLTYHRGGRRLVCHYCDASHPVPKVCNQCGNPELDTLGLGTEGLVEELELLLPEARVRRMDRDTTRTKNAHLNILAEMTAGNIDILVGTQMIAKGHDLPSVTLVGVVCADQGIHVPDFRASEGAFSLLTQVAGRAGRALAGGRVMLQAFDPELPAIHHAVTHDYAAFAEGELAMREALGFPPYGRVVRLLLRDRNPNKVTEAAAALSALVAALPGSVKGLGPAQPPLTMLRGEHRQHLLLMAEKVGILRQATHWLLAQAAADKALRRVRLDVDVDPQSML